MASQADYAADRGMREKKKRTVRRSSNSSSGLKHSGVAAKARRWTAMKTTKKKNKRIMDPF
jgi:hypothetical protein